jgi:hypothetical protein
MRLVMGRTAKDSQLGCAIRSKVSFLYGGQV